MAGFAIDIERQDGSRFGPGPLATATRWQRTRRLSLIGTVEMSAPATDDRTSLLRLRRYMRCYGERAGSRQELGLGIIDRLDIDTSGRVLTASGPDLFRELARGSVDFLALHDESGGVPIPMPLFDALDAILADYNAQADPDWTIDYSTFGSVGDTTNGNNTILNVTNIQNWAGRVGSPIYGAGIPAGATVTDVDVGAATVTINPDPTATATDVPITRAGVFWEGAGESVLAALAKVAELTGQSFRLGVGREIVWLHDMRPASGIRAVQDVDPVAAESNRDICLITSLRYMQDSSEVISHVVPWGSGVGPSRMAMATSSGDPNATGRTAPAGYTLNLDDNILSRDAAETDYGYSIRHQSFNDIGPTLEDTDPDYVPALIAARNQLFDAALEYLRTQSYPQESFRVDITKLDREVLPGETIRLIYKGRVEVVSDQPGPQHVFRWVDIDTDLIVLESTTELTDAGVHTPRLVVATLPRWPANDRQFFVTMARQTLQAQQHAQPTAFAARTGAISGTINRIPYFATATTLAASPLQTDGTGLSIGTGAAPLVLVDVQGSGGQFLGTRIAAAANGATLALRKATTGTTAVASGDEIGVLNFAGYDGAAYQTRARIRAIADGAVSAGSVPIALQFATSPSGSLLERMRIASNGNIGIGVTTPTARLHLAAGTATASTAPLKFTSGPYLTAPEPGVVGYNGRFALTESDSTRRYIVQAVAATKTTAGAPYANDGYVEMVVNGTTIRVMTTA